MPVLIVFPKKGTKTSRTLSISEKRSEISEKAFDPKRHTIVKVPWPINYWVIDKATHVKGSPTPVKSVFSSVYAGSTSSKSEIASHWLPTATTLKIMDPNQP